jgi:hypothetical protein
MKVIFLDHYGVMVTSLVELKRTKTSLPSIDEMKLSKILDPFNKECVRCLNEILSKSNAEIVITSDWMRSISFEEISKFYLDQGIVKMPIGYVGGVGDVRKSRISGISDFLSKTHVEKYVCIDDIYLEIDNFIWCQDPFVGIGSNIIKNQILNYLT